MIEFAEVNGNRAAGRKFNVNESNIRDWRKLKHVLMNMPKEKKSRRSGRTKANVTISLTETNVEQQTQSESHTTCTTEHTTNS
jgi:Brinker DNA-binding domain